MPRGSAPCVRNPQTLVHPCFAEAYHLETQILDREAGYGIREAEGSCLLDPHPKTHYTRAGWSKYGTGRPCAQVKIQFVACSIIHT